MVFKTKLCSLLILILFTITLRQQPSFADWTATGKFQYQDREFDLNGFTGTVTNKPIRYADVEIIDVTVGGSTVLASGATDANGDFSIAVTDSSTRDVKARCLTRSEETLSLKIIVKNHAADSGSDNNPDEAVISVSSNTTSTHAPNDNLSFGTITAAVGSGGEEFNIFDVLVDGSDYVASLAGSRPAVLVTAFWESGSNDGTYYCSSGAGCGTDNSIHLLGTSTDSDGYDDTVIVHEYGHFVSFNYSKDDNPGGSHSLTNANQDMRLSWSEGWATFFSCALRDFKGFSRPEIYVDTNGTNGSSNTLLFSYEVEVPSFAVFESDNELSVTAILWDIFDTTVTQDETHGTDDDMLDGSSIANAMNEIWEVFNTYLPTAENISIEDFWDGWFSASINNSYFTELSAIFSNRSVEFETDGYEPDDSPESAYTIETDGAIHHHTYYARGSNHTGDNDWVKFRAEKGTGYAIKTSNLGNGADTVFSLFNIDGVTLITTNDDVVSGTDLSSHIAWNPSASGYYFVKSNQYSGPGAIGTYGSYDLSIEKLAIISIIPDSSSTEGGTVVTITGEGFLNGAGVTIGGNSATSVNVISGTTIIAVIPSGPDGAKNVIVTNPSGTTGTGGLSATLEEGITYTSSNSNSGGGGGCFIATAAYGSPQAKEVAILSNFRDKYLLNNNTGKRFVAFYYQKGPELAEFVARHEILKKLVRLTLKPLILILMLSSDL